MTYYIKQIGSTDNPIKDEMKFNDLNYIMHFEKVGKDNRNHPNVCTGDILIAIGVGQSYRILAIYKISSRFREATFEDCPNEYIRNRWPWVVNTTNLTPTFGTEWRNHDIQIDNLRQDFLKLFPNENITMRSQSLGALKHGKGYIQINKKFGEFLFNEVKKYN